MLNRDREEKRDPEHVCAHQTPVLPKLKAHDTSFQRNCPLIVSCTVTGYSSFCQGLVDQSNI